MLEFMFCSMLTILPDYLFRHHVQGKRIGYEITFFTMWYELRWGITSCAVLTISLITMIFYYHPATSSVASYYRTITILPESGGRVTEVLVINNQLVEKGATLFRLDPSSQQAAVDTARSKVAEADAAIEVSDSELAAAKGGVAQAEAARELVDDDYRRNKELLDRGSGAVPEAEVERLENLLHVRQGQLDAALANFAAVEEKIDVLLPAQKASAMAALEQAETELDKTVIYAGVTRRIEQFALRVGDYVSPVLRPAGILVPSDSGHNRFQAGFGQITAPVIKPGMIAEMGCLSKPFSIIPMVVTDLQDVIPSGQVRPSDRLVDPQDNARPGTLTVYLEPLYPGSTDDIPPGSTCIANAYSNNHDRLETEDLGVFHRVFLHAVDTVAVVHAVVLRMKMLVLPVQTLVFSGH